MEFEKNTVPVEGSTPTQIIRHLLPARCKETSATHFVKTIKTDAGEVHEFEFDFVPRLPTWEDLENHLPHNCTTCEWDWLRGKNTVYCRTPTATREEHCDNWSLSPEAIRQARLSYYTAMHEERYGAARLSL